MALGTFCPERVPKAQRDATVMCGKVLIHRPVSSRQLAGSCVPVRTILRHFLWRGFMRSGVGYFSLCIATCAPSPMGYLSILLHVLFPLQNLQFGPSQKAAIMISTCLDLALLCHPVLAFLTISRPKMQAQQSRWQYFLLSFLSLLAIRYANTSYTQVPQEVIADVCQTKDQPNPIASLYPMNATGTLNGTISVIPITLELARELIPSRYRILEHAYRAILPSFPKGMYPAVLQALHDHEVQAFGYHIPDFSVRYITLQPTR
jgi:hypothetical protein